MRVDLFDYDLPADRIAQKARPRGPSRLLVLDRATGAVAHRALRGASRSCSGPGDLLVRNDVRVRHARLYGRGRRGPLVEIFLLAPIGGGPAPLEALAKPGTPGEAGTARFAFADGLSPTSRTCTRTAAAACVRPARRRRPPRAHRPRSAAPLHPPRARRARPPEDREAYQTVFAREPLAVAAPTAGLHFTTEILARDPRSAACEIADLTLAVGAGTFKPVTAEDTSAHVLDAEEVSLPGRDPRRASPGRRRPGGRVVAVGTTVTRALEAAARLRGARRRPAISRFSTDLFITPGFEFRVVDALLTNFHLPRSTLLMLVCAFAGPGAGPRRLPRRRSARDISSTPTATRCSSR